MCVWSLWVWRRCAQLCSGFARCRPLSAGLLRTWGGFFTVAHVLVMILTIPSHPLPSPQPHLRAAAADTSLTEISAPKPLLKKGHASREGHHIGWTGNS